MGCRRVGKSHDFAFRSVMDVGVAGSLHGYTPSPNDSWHQDISGAAVDPNSAGILTNGFGAVHLHADFGSGNAGDGVPFGIPYVVVDSSVTPLQEVPPTVFITDSDDTPAPIPAVLPIEDNPPDCLTQPIGDQHTNVIDKHTGVIYEWYQMDKCNGTYSASNGAIWDGSIANGAQRPFGYTSVDAAGLSVFEGLIRFDEIQAGVINHATRFTTGHHRCLNFFQGDCQGAFVLPATHSTNDGLNDPGNIIPVFGMKMRLQASFDISGFSPTNQIILTAWKKYGLMDADTGGSGFFQGTPDSRWDDNDLTLLNQIPISNFDIVTIGTQSSARQPPSTGAPPIINSFTASATTIQSGQSVTLTPSMTGQSYMYIQNAGFTRGDPLTVTPTATTTYTLVGTSNFLTTNQDSSGNNLRPMQALTVTVTGAPASTTKRSLGRGTFRGRGIFR